MASHVSIYEPSRRHPKLIMSQLKNEEVRCYVFAFLDADYGIASAQMSFAKKHGSQLAHRLRRITLIGQMCISSKKWAVCVLYQLNFLKGPLLMSAK